VQLLVCVDDDPVGMIGFTNVNERWGAAELGYGLAPEYHGNGYATEAARLLVAYGFDQRRLYKVYAKVSPHNEASQRVLEKVGFEREGVHPEQAFVDGEHVDVYRYGLLSDEYTPHPSR
jgi:RimJ/RimL family protein N-acetyltransferase